jgi:Arc/MetJ-type ribon-helix-helix transcriptional regulator
MATLTITLPDDLTETLRARVAEAGYPDESALIADLLRDSAEPPEVTARWIAEVGAIVDRIDAGTEPLYSAEEVLAHLSESRHRRRG